MKIKLEVSTKLQTQEGEFVIEVFTNDIDNKEYIVLRTKNINDDCLLRIHSKCFTGDCLHSLYCDCYEQLQDAKIRISESGNGLIIYLDQEGRGIGLINKLKAYELQRNGLDTYEANIALGLENDYRTYEICVPILKYYGLTKLNVITNNLDKINDLKKHFILNRVPQIIAKNEFNEKYLLTKKEKMGHLL